MAKDLPPTDSITIEKDCDEASLNDGSDFSNSLPVDAKIVYMGKTHVAKNVLSDFEVVCTPSPPSLPTRNLRGNLLKTASQSNLTQGIAASLGYGTPAESSNLRISLARQSSYRKTGSDGNIRKMKMPIGRSLSSVSGRRPSFSRRPSNGSTQPPSFSRRSSSGSTQSEVPTSRSSLEFARRGSNDMRRGSMTNSRPSLSSGRSSMNRSFSMRKLSMSSLEPHEETEFEESISHIRADFDDVKGIIEDGKSFAELKATLAESGAITNELLKQILPLYAAQKRRENLQVAS